MSRSRLEVRSHRGGVVTRVTPELMSSDQLRSARNAREWIVGAASRRGGSARIHGAPIGSEGAVQGVTQWSPPGGRQVVVVRGGNLYAGAAGEEPALRATDLGTGRASFAVHRLEAVPTLYVTAGAGYFRFDGSVAQAVPGAPVMDRIHTFNSRVFGTVEGTSWVHYTAVDEPEDFSVGNDGGLAKIETYDSDPLVEMTVLGSSLLFFKENNISRFTGYSKYDIQIDTGTDGISDEVGLIAPGSLVRVQNSAFFLSDRGPYLATTGGVQEIGFNVEPVFDFDDRETWSRAVSVHNRRRREVWMFLPSPGSPMNDIAWVFNYRTGTWWGPWDFPFPVCAAARYENESGVESVVLAGNDGFLRDGDVSGEVLQDDVHLDGTGGQAIPLSVEYAPLKVDLQAPKLSGPEWRVRADLGETGALVFDVENEFGDIETSAPIESEGVGVKSYGFRPHFRGDELTVRASDYSTSPVQINALQVTVNVGQH